MNYLYLIEHVKKIGKYRDGKFIGICSTNQKAKKIVKEYENLSGFKDSKKEFIIKKIELDKKYYTTGFISWYKKGEKK